MGYDLTTHRSKGVQELPADRYDLIISMGCEDDCPYVPDVRREDDGRTVVGEEGDRG